MKFKKIVFLIISFIAAILLIYPHITSFVLKKTQKDTLLLTPGEYEVGESFLEGDYDIEAKEDVVFQGKLINKGGQVKAIPLQNGEIISIEQGSIWISKAKFNKINFSNNEYTVKNSGFYYVGEHLNPGQYSISFTSETNDVPFIQILNNNRDVLQTLNLNKNKITDIKLDDGMILQIEKTLFKEIKTLNILLVNLDE